MLHPRARPFSPPSPLPSYPYPILHPFLGFLWFRLLKNIKINKNRKKIDRKKTSANLKLPNNLLCLASFVMQGKRTLTWSYPAQHTTRSADPSKLDLSPRKEKMGKLYAPGLFSPTFFSTFLALEI